MGQVVPVSVASSNVPGSCFGLSVSFGAASRTQSVGSSGANCLHKSELDSSHILASFIGPCGQHDGLNPGLSHVDEAPSVPSVRSLRSSIGPSISVGPLDGGTEGFLGLHWGSPVFLLPGKSFSNLPPQVTFSTDASRQGGGAVWDRLYLSGTWSRIESQLHVNLLELKAVFLALQGFEEMLISRSVLFLSDFLGYAFPPFSMIPRVLDKIAEEVSVILLLAPLGPSRPWFPRLLSLLGGFSKRLPVSPGLLYQPLSHQLQQHPDRLHLTLWPLSGSRDRRLGFLRELSPLQQNPSDSPLDVLTIPDWQVFVNGVPVRRAVHAQLL